MKNVSPSVFKDCCTMGQTLADQHGEGVILLAGLHALCDSLFTSAGSQWGVDVQPLRKEFEACIRARMSTTGMQPDAFESAVSGLQRAGQTAAYIAAIPE